MKIDDNARQIKQLKRRLNKATRKINNANKTAEEIINVSEEAKDIIDTVTETE